MIILITGAAGFIGSNLSNELLKLGYTILGIDNFDDYYSKDLKEKNLDTLFEYPKFRFYEADILDTAALDEIFYNRRPFAVIHLAAAAGVRHSFLYPQKYYDVNVTGTMNILEMCKKYGAGKLIYASSSSVYGDRTEAALSEDLCGLIQKSPYAVSKYEAEGLIRTFWEASGIQSYILRFFSVYGPKQRPDLVISKFTKLLSENKPLPVDGDGSMKRDYTHVLDICRGVIGTLHYAKTPYEIFNLGSGSPVSVLELIRYIEAALGKKAQIEFRPQQRGDVYSTCASTAKAAGLLSWRPQIGLKEGIIDYCKIYYVHQSE